jgi:hypothetical protein
MNWKHIIYPNSPINGNLLELIGASASPPCKTHPFAFRGSFSKKIIILISILGSFVRNNEFSLLSFVLYLYHILIDSKPALQNSRLSDSTSYHVQPKV